MSRKKVVAVGRGRRGPRILGLVVLVLIAAAGCTPSAETSPSGDDVVTIGMLRSVPDPDHDVLIGELRNQGWRVGDKVRLLPTDPAEIYESIDDARAALRRWVEDDVDFVIAFSTPYAQLLVDEAPEIPGLFMVNDPIAAGLVVDPRRPEGHLTGLTFRTPADRTLDIASRAVGGISRVGYLWPTDDPAVPAHMEGVQRSTAVLGFDFVDASFSGPDAVSSAVGTLVDAGVDIVFLASSNATIRALGAIEEALASHGLAAVANTDLAEFALVVLTPDRGEMRRQLGRQAARLLSGSPVSSIPVEDPRRFVVTVNRSKAEELGLPPIDAGLLREADIVR